MGRGIPLDYGAPKLPKAMTVREGRNSRPDRKGRERPVYRKNYYVDYFACLLYILMYGRLSLV